MLSVFWSRISRCALLDWLALQMTSVELTNATSFILNNKLSFIFPRTIHGIELRSSCFVWLLHVFKLSCFPSLPNLPLNKHYYYYCYTYNHSFKVLKPTLFFFFEAFICSVFIYVFWGVGHVPWYQCGCQTTVYESLLSPSTILVLGVELGTLYLAASTFLHWAICWPITFLKNTFLSMCSHGHSQF